MTPPSGQANDVRLTRRARLLVVGHSSSLDASSYARSKSSILCGTVEEVIVLVQALAGPGVVPAQPVAAQPIV